VYFDKTPSTRRKGYKIFTFVLNCQLIGGYRYEFPLEEVDGHMVEINMYDKDHTSKDEFLGYAAIDVRNFMQQSSLLAGVGPS
jgi:hypothetical protein